MACEADYWYHGASGGYPGGPNCTAPDGAIPTDLSNNSAAVCNKVMQRFRKPTIWPLTEMKSDNETIGRNHIIRHRPTGGRRS